MASSARYVSLLHHCLKGLAPRDAEGRKVSLKSSVLSLSALSGGLRGYYFGIHSSSQSSVTDSAEPAVAEIALQNHPFLQPGFELALSVFLFLGTDQVGEFIGIGLEIEQSNMGRVGEKYNRDIRGGSFPSACICCSSFQNGCVAKSTGW